MKLFRNDVVGPLPWWVYAAIILFDILLVFVVASAIIGVGDWIEDLIWPGGIEIPWWFE
jgi:hypothetical protein